ncbi:DOMON-like domain-containing protein [Novosphingobium sp. Fuku2-ISO-50]|uniref:DOMON-like domain-containing protein n=1 Tax=Novosphingobium sp. Fuku2-ISO-50 TaxID=1739114 RepID=UPI00076CA405|nr:DOMON-like domain-containing protein [Novosphingobium sp. Fuku2-ISO-50]KUR79200.1 hypothetical protein AQZ50_04925 [Novosphingobium sp. Fuku2-ISO-50]
MLQLIPHPAHPPLRVGAIAARVLSLDANWCVLRWKVEGAADLVVPPFAGRARTDGLWQTTCFELFVAPVHYLAQIPDPAHAEPVEACAPIPAGPGSTVSRILRQAQDERLRQAQDERREGWGDEGGATGYTEFNFSPSERWAAYDFNGYRTGMAERAVPRPPVITPRRGGDVLFCDVAIPVVALPPLPWRYGLTAVIEEAGGVKSFWAAVHAQDVPDFHDPACLSATLAAPDAA